MNQQAQKRGYVKEIRYLQWIRQPIWKGDYKQDAREENENFQKHKKKGEQSNKAVKLYMSESQNEPSKSSKF